MAYQPYIKKSNTEIVELPLNASLLDGKSPSYYLDYNNLINIPSSSKVEDYYWANIKISSSSSTTTSPTFKNINSINDSDYHSISTGTNDSSFCQSRKFRGEGNADTYYHAVDFGYSGHNQVDFYEYGGIYTFYQNNTADTSSKVELLKITPSTLTYKGIGVAMENESANSLDLSIDNSTFVITATLKDKSGKSLSTKTIDLPLESVVVNGSYDSTNKKVILTLQNGSKIDFSVADLVSGLQSEITSSNKLDYSLIANTPTIPTKTSQLTNDSNFLTSHQDISGKLDKSGGTMTGSLTIEQGNAINVSQYNDASGVSLMNNGNGNAIQFGSSLKPARMFSSVQPEWYKNGVSQGVLAIKGDIPTKTSQLTNDSGFLTSHQNLDNYVTLDSSQTITGTKKFTSIAMDTINSLTLGNAMIRQNTSSGDIILGSVNRKTTIWGNTTRPIYSANGGGNNNYLALLSDLDSKLDKSNFNTPVIVSNGTTSIRLPSKGIYMFLYYSFKTGNTHIVLITYNGTVISTQYVSSEYYLLCTTDGLVKDNSSSKMNARVFKISDYGWGD